MEKPSLMRSEDTLVSTINIYWQKEEDTDKYIHVIEAMAIQGDSSNTIQSLSYDAIANIALIPRLLSVVCD